MTDQIPVTHFFFKIPQVLKRNETVTGKNLEPPSSAVLVVYLDKAKALPVSQTSLPYLCVVQSWFLFRALNGFLHLWTLITVILLRCERMYSNTCCFQSTVRGKQKLGVYCQLLWFYAHFLDFTTAFSSISAAAMVTAYSITQTHMVMIQLQSITIIHYIRELDPVTSSHLVF